MAHSPCHGHTDRALPRGRCGVKEVAPGSLRQPEKRGALSSAGVVLASLLLAFETLQLPPRLLYVADGLEVACLSLFTVEVGVNRINTYQRTVHISGF